MKSVCLQFLIVMLFACNDNALVYSKDIFHKSVVNESLQTPHKKNELFSNYGIAQDRDSYVKLRAKPSVKSKIKTKIPSGEIIYIFSEDCVATGWYIIDYYVSDGKLVTGYVHKSRIKLIDSFKNIPAIFQNVSSATFIAKDVTLVLNAGKSHNNTSANKSLHSRGQEGSSTPETIMWGTDGTSPTSEYKSISIISGKSKQQINRKAFKNFYNVSLENTRCFLDESTKTLFLTSLNGDGASAYEVLFIFRNGRHVKTYACQAS